MPIAFLIILGGFVSVLANDTLWDVAIVGAGPAGSTAAYHLASKGHKVLLLDKKDFPRDKVCGDGLIPDALKCLERMNLLSKVMQEGRVVNKVTVFSPSRIRCEFPGFTFVTMKRYRFDAMLVEHAVSAGAVLLRASVVDIDADEGGATVITQDGRRVNAKMCLLATGARIELAKKLGVITHEQGHATSLRCYVHSDLSLEELVFSFDKSILPGEKPKLAAYGWIFPLGNREFNGGRHMT